MTASCSEFQCKPEWKRDMIEDIEQRKSRARAWFEQLQEQICATFERLEAQADPALYPGAPGQFIRTPWRRGEGSDDLGGGRAAMMRGRLFEKVGVHVSTVYGEFSPEFAKDIKGAQEDPRFWASGISLIAHMRNPNIPAAHMNTRMIVTQESWFGGGGDLNPTLSADRHEEAGDTKHFHAALADLCGRHDPDYYPRFKAWADQYFHLPHRQQARGTGGIFFDHLASGDWERDFAFVRDVGTGFETAFTDIIQARQADIWDEGQRAEQAFWRGRYVEFNLLYDRGTIFGLKTGGNVETILSSMPPSAEW